MIRRFITPLVIDYRLCGVFTVVFMAEGPAFIGAETVSHAGAEESWRATRGLW